MRKFLEGITYASVSRPTPPTAVLEFFLPCTVMTEFSFVLENTSNNFFHQLKWLLYFWFH